jgi:release factor glutamine methyltransferase
MIPSTCPFPLTTPAAAPAAHIAPSSTGPADEALIEIGCQLQQSGYRFATVTPDTHRLVNARPENAQAHDLQGIFGWSRPFHPGLISPGLLAALELASAIEPAGDGLLHSRIRFSTVEGQLLLHSAFPTTAHDAVFLGPDTYRFIALLRRTLVEGPSLLEIGTGTGAAVLSLADRFSRLVATDINPLAVRYARVNAVLAGCGSLDLRCADLTKGVEGEFSAIIINPPYLIDPHGPRYRDGGTLGIEIALSMLAAALPLLAPGGSLVLYTGAPIIAGRDLLADALAPILGGTGLDARYEVLDVDVFGSSLAEPAYAGIDRIAVVAVIVGRRCCRHPAPSALPGLNVFTLKDHQ